ncbi:MAG: phosphoribosylformylglycinamidine synthase [Veillonella caviae]|uniref:phosphoribosylformylglycinamidine synthase n=1 Tax=Veillonella caviae TaxID=248316 RepID=UPI002A91B38E|nr:phosphoribosylformylglycinamidine synthase [Veillonella caviae]MDY5482322.1 phosphoribosylformylglycinamidine synthase [Veillonella caviae]
MAINRLFVRKRDAFAHEANQVLTILQQELNIPATAVTIYERYDVENLNSNALETSKHLIFSEPPVDIIADTLEIPADAFTFAVEYVPGQYDQRADSAEQCISMLTLTTGHTVRCARVYVLEGTFTEEQKRAIKSYYINPVDSRESNLDMPSTLALDLDEPQAIASIDNFTSMTDKQLTSVIKNYGLAMTLADIKLVQEQYANVEKRNPTITEIRLFDTYWSDHCRHTTFMTELTDITIEENRFTVPIIEALEEYTEGRNLLYTTKVKACSLMDMATLAVKELRHAGGLQNLDESEEINACTIIVPVDVDGQEEEWLLLFKNETHNHPTEIEPFGGAATCLGGCIRDPLSGRSYVYQAMRITGSGDPHTPLADTLVGKLPQKKITQDAAHGYSSYGNQIGLATGEVKEYYHPGYVAKRMEIGAVIGAAPRSAVRREVPTSGDVIVLLGGKTGRDGCGGATGSSKEHTVNSLSSCGAEVQKGNALTERKIQRLFRRPEVTTLIKRCNDFGAGGVSVAIGELTDGVTVNLDLIPKKYAGLNGTELAISESQERMACVIASVDVETFAKFCDEENLEYTVVADVTDTNRLIMTWRGDTIVDISRDFLNTNGASQQQEAIITAPTDTSYFRRGSISVDNFKDQWISAVSTLNTASQQGLAERFDSTVGANTVLMPFGGKYQKTPTQGMVAKLPVLHGETTTTSIMTHGFVPELSAWSPYHGAQYAVLLSVAKLVALGGCRKDAYLTLQEYFERLGSKESWGKPVAALLGAYKAQKELEIGAIGGKDSMSGTFMDLTVPPTLVSFAAVTAPIKNITSQDIKGADHRLVFFDVPRTYNDTPDWDKFKENCDLLHEQIEKGRVYSAYVVDEGGIPEAVTKMALGNNIGVKFDTYAERAIFQPALGAFIVEVDITAVNALLELPDVKVIAVTQEKPVIEWNGQEVSLQEVQAAYEAPLADIFPLQATSGTGEAVAYIHDQKSAPRSNPFGAKPKVLIPVFPGTNCEFDSARAFERAGAEADIVIIRNQTSPQLQESIDIIQRKLKESQILMFPGGFSGGDEPDGSGKFMATLFRNPALTEGLENLLYKQDGLVLGICNGFQALIKLGLLPSGHVETLTADHPTLTFNTIGRHLSHMVQTKVISTKSPWMSEAKAGEIYTVPISHGEGRFIASPQQVLEFNKSGQIATQYVDFDGIASMDGRFNPNQSVAAIEGIYSPDGRVFGKMAHSERCGQGISKNIPGNLEMPIFTSGVKYFK